MLVFVLELLHHGTYSLFLQLSSAAVAEQALEPAMVAHVQDVKLGPRYVARRSADSERTKHIVAEAMRAATDLMALYSPVQLAARGGRVTATLKFAPSIRYQRSNRMNSSSAADISDAANQGRIGDIPFDVASNASGSFRVDAARFSSRDVFMRSASNSGDATTRTSCPDYDNMAQDASNAVQRDATTSVGQNGTTGSERDVRRVVSFSDLGLDSPHPSGQ